jgi:signal transduction histidine kinase
MIVGSGLVGFCLLLVMVTTIVTLVGMSRSVEQIEEEYEERAEIGRVRELVGTASALLQAKTPDNSASAQALGRADNVLTAYIKSQSSQEAGNEEHQAEEIEEAKEVVELIEGLRLALAREPFDRAATIQTFDEVDHKLGELIGQTDEQVSYADNLADRELRYGLTLFGVAMSVGVLLGLIGVIYTYRSVTGPVRQLRDQVRQTSLQLNVKKSSTREADDLNSIQTDFVHVVDELNALYRTLEDRVKRKSRELVRAERLASVGYLAAGIAHEINNPLNAISGYSELVSRQLNRENNGAKWDDAIESLSVVHREAMRCKGITERLLSLSRKSTSAQEPVNLGLVIEQTITLIRGLPHLAQRTIDNTVSKEDDLLVWGVHAELTQVFLNIFVNAIEACEPGSGRVAINAREIEDEMIEVSVVDNGCGMDELVIEHLFEPFFTSKPGQQAVGTGLGMSIVHAIVRDYGGNVHAYSDGPGLGSAIKIVLPVYDPSQHEQQA